MKARISPNLSPNRELWHQQTVHNWIKFQSNDVERECEPKSTPSEVGDDQWALIEPLIPIRLGGRFRKTEAREVVDTFLYLLRTG